MIVNSKPVLVGALLGLVPALTAAMPSRLAPRQECSATLEPVDVAELPDPFTNSNGEAVTDWACRRQEILQLMYEFELGEKPGAPESVTASMSGGTLDIEVSDGGGSTSFSVDVSAPSGDGPHPAIIAYGFPSIPIPEEVATITFTNDDVAAQQGAESRGQGAFYDLYGSDHPAGAMSAWAWGVSRILDALEATPGANIDPERVGVTGCSRNGKGAFVAGALDERIALTLPQESGSGGSACWRLSDDMMGRGIETQTASQIITENCWLGSAFDQYVDSVNQLPEDHHMLAGLVAPRGLLVIDLTDIDWLGPWSSYGCMLAGRKIYEALGATDSMGFSQVGGHEHCQFPSGQQGDLDAFINRFLLGQDADTDIFTSDGNHDFDESQWCPWTVPSLG